MNTTKKNKKPTYKRLLLISIAGLFLSIDYLLTFLPVMIFNGGLYEIFFLFPLFAPISAYILFRYTSSWSCGVALGIFLIATLLTTPFLIISFIMYYISIFLGYFICLFMVILFLFPSRVESSRKKALLSLLLFFFLFPPLILLHIYSYPFFKTGLWIFSPTLTSVLIWFIPIASIGICCPIYSIIRKKKKEFNHSLISENSLPAVEYTQKKRKINFLIFFMYVIGGILLFLAMYLLSQMGIMFSRRWERILIFLLPVIYWGSSFVALSSKTKLSDLTFISVPLIVTFWVFIGESFLFLELDDVYIIRIYKILFGLVFTSLLIGYDLKHIPKGGFLEHTIYGLSFVPVVSAFVFITIEPILAYVEVIPAFLVLAKVILTAGYVYKRIGVV